MLYFPHNFDVYIMASKSQDSKVLLNNFTAEGLTKELDDEKHEPDDKIDIEGILNGAQLSDKQEFESKKGGKACLVPVIVDFRRLLQTKCATQVVPGIENNDLLHAVVGLYDVSLSEMTPDVLYTAVCEKWARTIILLKDVDDAVKDLEEKRKNPKKAKEQEEACPQLVPIDSKEDAKDESEDVWEPDEEKPTTFAEVYSDTEAEDEEESDEEEEDFSKGINAFLETVRLRKKRLLELEGPVTADHIGPENRIVGAATYEKSYVKPSDKVIHLTLIAVRKRFRKWGIGKYLITQIKDPNVVGHFDAVVVHADNSATDFFERYGFSDDIVLNSRWNELAEQFTNCTLMCYLPPFMDQTHMTESIPELDLLAMEKEINHWRNKSIDAYRAEVSCVRRMRQEIIHLRALVSSQQQLITTLALDNKKLQNDKYELEKDYLEYRFIATKAAFIGNHYDDTADTEAEELIRQLEKEAQLQIDKRNLTQKYEKVEDLELQLPIEDGEANQVETKHKSTAVDTSTLGSETYRKSSSEFTSEAVENAADLEKVSHVFREAVNEDREVMHRFQVKHVTKAIMHPYQAETFHECLRSLQEPGMVTQLFFCGSLEHPDRIKHIFTTGFSEEDYSYGEYGVGLYFSKYPTKAAQFSVLGKVIVAEVGLGSTQTIVKKDSTRKAPDKGHDSIITPGRLFKSGEMDSMLCQEYVVFNHQQVIPTYLIEYVPVFE